MSPEQFDAQDETTLLHDQFDEPTSSQQSEQFDFSEIAQEVAPSSHGAAAEVPIEPGEPFTPHPGGGVVLLTLGCLMLVGGAAFATFAVMGTRPIPDLVTQIGVTPAGVIFTALIVVALAIVQRGQVRVGNRTDGYVAPLHDMLTFLMERAQNRVEQEDIDRALVAIQRLDEKIQNLSRATKMYGKPLVDVANRMQEAANHLQEIEGSLDGVVDKVESSSRRLGEDLSKLIDATGSDDSFPTEQFEDLVAATRKSANLLADLKMDLETAPDPAQSIDSLRTTIEDVRGDLSSLKQQLSSARSDDEVLGGLQQAVQSIHTQVAGLSNSIASLERSPTPASSTPAPAAPPSAAPQAPPQKASTPAPDSKSGLAQSIAGKRKSKGKNVLGSIAKLRQMRN